jgi:hypothetical protein
VIASGLYSHVLYTGLVGMAVGVVLGRRDPRPPVGRVLAATPLVVVAVLGHFLWNSPILELFPEHPWEGIEWLQILVATAVKGLPFLLFLVIVVRLAHGRERRWLETALASEVGGDGVTREELYVLRSIRRRRGARRDLAMRAGDRAARLLGRLQREQVNLAMIRSRVAADDDPALVRQRALCRSIRDALAAIPGAEAATGPRLG